MSGHMTVTRLGDPESPGYLVKRGDSFWSEWHLDETEAAELARALRAAGL